MMKRLWMSLVFLCCTMMLPASASAQWYYYGGGDVLSSTTFYGATTSSTALTTVGIVFLATGGMKAELLRDYLQENDAAVQVAVRTGQGEAACDLAQLFGVSPANEARFGAMLRAQRTGLLATTGQTVSIAQAERFIALVVTGMEADVALAQDVARWRDVGGATAAR